MRPRAAFLVALCATLFVAQSALLLGSCAEAREKRRLTAFSSSLAEISGLVASKSVPKLDAAFGRAYGNARTSSDWLSLLKRARAAEGAGDLGRYLKSADRARKALPGSEPVAAAAAHAYLRGGRSAEAFALFGKPLEPSARPGLWAEAFVASRSQLARAPVATSADFGRLAETLGEPRAYLGAAVVALIDSSPAGDRLTARAWLDKALAAGVAAPPELLWDCGAYEALAASSDLAARPDRLAMMGDAAWMTGDTRLAARRWERSVSLSPKRSWKTYVDLALAFGEKGEASMSYWSRLKGAFLSGPASSSRNEALVAYAAHLARSGGDAEALGMLGSEKSDDSRIELLAATIRGKRQPEGRYVADLERLAEEKPDDAGILGAALRALFVRGMYGEAALLADSGARRGLAPEYGWYYKAAVLTARGDFEGAARAIEASAGQSRAAGSGAAGAYALGSLYAALGDSVKSVAAFSSAAANAAGVRERCASLKALGRALSESGDFAKAAAAFRSAVAADPADAEAAVLARGLGLGTTRKGASR